MKSKLILFLFVMLSSYNLYADDVAGPYIGIKAGVFTIDVDESESLDVDDPSALGFVIGGKFNRFIGMEFEYNQSDDAGFDVENSSVEGQLDIQTMALYFVFRTPGKVYFKAKAGVLHEKIDGSGGSSSGSGGSCDFLSSTCVSTSVSEKDTGLSAGVGIGFMLGKSVSLEAEYTIIEEDVGYASAGLNIHF